MWIQSCENRRAGGAAHRLSRISPLKPQTFRSHLVQMGRLHLGAPVAPDHIRSLRVRKYENRLSWHFPKLVRPVPKFNCQIRKKRGRLGVSFFAAETLRQSQPQRPRFHLMLQGRRYCHEQIHRQIQWVGLLIPKQPFFHCSEAAAWG